MDKKELKQVYCNTQTKDVIAALIKLRKSRKLKKHDNFIPTEESVLHNAVLTYSCFLDWANSSDKKERNLADMICIKRQMLVNNLPIINKMYWN